MSVVCECRSRRCRRKLHLTEAEYRTLSRIGYVLSAECARREERNVIANFNGYRVVVPPSGGKAFVPLSREWD